MASTRGEEYARRQRAEGRAKRTLWLNPEEFEAAKQARDRLHGGAAPAAQTDLEDAAIEGAVSVDTAADEKAALAKLGEAIPADRRGRRNRLPPAWVFRFGLAGVIAAALIAALFLLPDSPSRSTLDPSDMFRLDRVPPRASAPRAPGRFDPSGMFRRAERE